MNTLDLMALSLGKAEHLARTREISEYQITEYLTAWNANPARFTLARWNGMFFNQYCRECKGLAQGSPRGYAATDRNCKCEG